MALGAPVGGLAASWRLEVLASVRALSMPPLRLMGIPHHHAEALVRAMGDCLFGLRN